MEIGSTKKIAKTSGETPIQDTATYVTKDDMYIVTKRVQQKIQKITVGWHLLVQWRDQSESWIHLKDLKKSHQIEVAEFSKA